MERYESEPIRLYDLMNEFAVHCPKCQGKAIVSVPQPFDFKNGVLKCTACHFPKQAKTACATKFQARQNVVNVWNGWLWTLLSEKYSQVCKRYLRKLYNAQSHQ